jgi:mono/diheme cytochrome c family protein
MLIWLAVLGFCFCRAASLAGFAPRHIRAAPTGSPGRSQNLPPGILRTNCKKGASVLAGSSLARCGLLRRHDCGPRRAGVDFWRARIRKTARPEHYRGQPAAGLVLFHDKGCLNCHLIAEKGGRRGPDLTEVANRLSKNQMILRISNGGVNMPAYAANLTPADMDALVAFLQSRVIPRPR